MIDAERRLLANALLDSSNQRFVLLSESCIPLFNFKTTYDHLMNSNISFLGSFDDPRKPGRGRYNPRMWPVINITDWRKGSQWFEVHRDIAVHIISDQKYYQVFQEHCHPPCYMDEHYFPTLANILYPELNSNRSITWVDWSRGGPHPGKFGWGDITDEFLNQIRHGSECVYNGNTTSMCYLFARKFLPQTLEPLLRIAPLLHVFDPWHSCRNGNYFSQWLWSAISFSQLEINPWKKLNSLAFPIKISSISFTFKLGRSHQGISRYKSYHQAF